MSDHAGHDHTGHDHGGHDHGGHDHAGHDHAGHDHAVHDHGPVAAVTTTVATAVAAAAGPSSVFGQIIVAKCVAMLVLGMGAFVLGVLPLKLAKWWRAKPSPTSSTSSASSTGSSSGSSSVHHHHGHGHAHGGHGHGHSHGGESAAGSPAVSLLLCFGGGVLLFTTLLHLQPEVREGVSRLQSAGRLPADIEHLGDLIFCAGFFMVFIVDEIAHSLLDRYYAAGRHGTGDDGDSAEDVLHRSMSLRRRSMSIPRASLQSGSPGSVTGGASTASIKELLKESSTAGGGVGGKQKRYHHHMHHHHHQHQPAVPWAASPDGHLQQQQQQTQYHHHNNNGLHDHQQRHLHHHLHADDVENQHRPKTASESSDGGGGDHSLRGLFAVLALSFHEVFEGLAIGLEERVDNMWYLLLAVATHKLVIAFCIGLELAWSKTRRAVLVVYVATFAAVTPAGIAIGMALVHYGGSGSVDGSQGVVAVVLQGLAAGTLLYVVFFEVLARHKQSGFLHLLSIMFGFVALLVLQMMTHHHSHGSVNDSHHHHDHDHDHDHSDSSHDHSH